MVTVPMPPAELQLVITLFSLCGALALTILQKW